MNSSGDYLTIDTPENVAFGYEVVGIGSRFLAAFVDTVLIIIIEAIVNLTVIILTSMALRNSRANENVAIWIAAFVGLLSFAIFWGYYIFFELVWNGQSPGKRWAGLRVIRTDGTPITLAESVIRNLIRLVDFLPLYYGLGVVTMFINRQSRRLGDLAAGTLVVRDRPDVTLASLAARPGPAGEQAGGAGELPLERLAAQDVQLAEEFVRRREELANREALARYLARSLAGRMELPPHWWTGTEAENFLLQIAQAGQEPAEEPE